MSYRHDKQYGIPGGWPSMVGWKDGWIHRYSTVDAAGVTHFVDLHTKTEVVPPEIEEQAMGALRAAVSA